jgi:cytochrome c oxidase assembly protein subunit 17
MESTWTSLFHRPLAEALATPQERFGSSPYKSKKKPCCVCKQTKRLRDRCIMNNDDEDICIDFMKAHKVCLRGKGFRVE